MKEQTTHSLVHRDSIAFYRGSVVTLETRQTRNRYVSEANPEEFAPVYFVQLTFMSASAQGEEGASFQPAESVEVSLDANNCDLLIEKLVEYRNRLRVPS